MPKFEIAYTYSEYRIRTVEADTEQRARDIVDMDADEGDLDHNAYTLDGHSNEITEVRKER